MTAAEPRTHSASLPESVEIRPLQLNSGNMDAVFSSLAPDLIWFDRFILEEQYGWRISAACPSAKRILDTIDLHCLREIRRAALHQNRQPEFADWFSDISLRELASIYRSDLSLLISDAEYSILTETLKLPSSLLHVTPFLVRPEDQTLPGQSPHFGERKNFITMGNFRHAPNADSVRYLYEILWPGIRKECPHAKMNVFGADLTPALAELNQPEKGFFVRGRADNALQMMKQSRVCLAPLRYGAGQKGKLLDAMLAGTPSVTTSIGAEGMQGDSPWPGAVENHPEAFRNAAIRLYQSETDWQSAHSFIPGLLKARFDQPTHAKALLKRIQILMDTPRNSTPEHLTGALLRHHQHRSTEYMSRWIEAKNK